MWQWPLEGIGTDGERSRLQTLLSLTAWGREVISPADSTCPSSVSSQGWWISPLQWKLWCSHFKGEKQRKSNKLYFVFFVSSFHFHCYLCKRVHASDFGTCAHFSQSPNKCKITHIWKTWGETIIVGLRLLGLSAMNTFSYTQHSCETRI